MKLAEIAAQLEVRLRGAEEVEIKGLQGIADAQPGELTFVSNPKYAAAARTTRASAIIVAEDFPELAKPTLRTPDPYFTFARAVELFYQPPRYAPGIHPSAVIDKSARIGRGAHIGAYVVIEPEVEIGENCVLLPHVVIYRGAKIGNNFFAHAHAMVREFCRIGNNVILQNGAIVGCDGFGFAKDPRGAWRKIPQSGLAVIAGSCAKRRVDLWQIRNRRNLRWRRFAGSRYYRCGKIPAPWRGREQKNYCRSSRHGRSRHVEAGHSFRQSRLQAR